MKAIVALAVVLYLGSLGFTLVFAVRGEANRDDIKNLGQLNSKLICVAGGFLGPPVQRAGESDVAYANRRAAFQAFQVLLRNETDCPRLVRGLSSKIAGREGVDASTAGSSGPASALLGTGPTGAGAAPNVQGERGQRGKQGQTGPPGEDGENVEDPTTTTTDTTKPCTVQVLGACAVGLNP